ncbi:MAG: dihydrodipicolinate synthase family protein [Proteobacteria bacterium]|nr:dihydrodipicolinate synthase family protein [Pseudomonadota bacterium]MBI3497411.1 dihydrodipicolinate synthase family protein [Pseudomonadota bacterium]
MRVDWKGVFPAVTTQFKDDGALDLPATAAHIERLIRSGVHGLIMLGTVGENCSLEWPEKLAVIRQAKETARGRVPILSGVAEFTTPLAIRYAGEMAKLGADGLMVLPSMVYKADGREAVAHFRAVARGSSLPIMVYNNPIVYGVDLKPEHFVELAEEKTIVSIKESSDDIRRLTDVINACGDRYIMFCGVDDLILESMMLGAVGWVSGLTNAFPAESARLYELALAGRTKEARELYRWFMPLLHLDCHSKLVQYIKLAQAMAGFGSEMVRPPRLKLEGAERERIQQIIRRAMDARPKLAA